MNCIYKLFRLSLLLLFGMPQRDGYIFARREIDGDDYYGYVLPNGQFRILFDQCVVYAGGSTR